VSFDANYNGVEGMLVCFNTKFQWKTCRTQL
jgi:hypothetical protein